MNFIVVTGHSGAGKSTALHALEDIGYFTVDNLPPKLWPVLIKEAKNMNVAVAIDVRAKDFLTDALVVLGELQEENSCDLLYLDASAEVLIKRYNFTRRVHPLPQASLHKGLEQEKSLLCELRGAAQWILDTSEFSAQQLVEEIQQHYGRQNGLQLRLISFGFKHGAPIDADNVFDVRVMPNPFYDVRLRPFDGRNEAVQNYVFQQEISGQDFYTPLVTFLTELVRNAAQRGRLSYTLAIGCTGGKHRSVAVVERLERDLDTLATIRTFHRDLNKTHSGGGW